MKRNMQYVLLALAALGFASTAAADGLAGKAEVFRSGDRLFVRLPLEAGAITANEQIVYTPVVVNGDDALPLAPVVFTGRIREKVNLRRERLYGTAPVPEGAFTNVVVRNRRDAAENTVLFEGDVPFEPWMAGGRVVLYRDLEGCAGVQIALPPLVVAGIAAPVQPQLSFIVPAEGPAKRRSEKITAVVHFPQGRSVLLRNFADNRRELQRIDSLTERLRGSDSLAIDRIALRGYASPEDTYAFNTRLSANRVRSIRKYLCDKFGFAEADFTTSTVPEDWDSLRRWVVVSDLPYRDDVLAVIDTVSDPDARDAGLWRIDGGKTYLKLLHEVYPQLRRVDYSIGYSLPFYTTSQAEQLVDVHPEWLSVTELCRLAASYGEDSPERAYVCAVAVECYPDDPCTCNNMACLALRRGDAQTAAEYLRRCPDDVETKNNLGVLCLMSGDRDAARQHFEAAARSGSEEAVYNLANFDNLEYE